MPTAGSGGATAERYCERFRQLKKQRTEQELEQIAIKVMQSGSKICPDCGQNTLVASFDEHYWKLRCDHCGFLHEDYMSGA